MSTGFQLHGPKISISILPRLRFANLPREVFGLNRSELFLIRVLRELSRQLWRLMFYKSKGLLEQM